MTTVLERRRAFWPHGETRSEAARLYASGQGLSLKEVLERYPNEVITISGGKPRGAARRAIYAHWALLQEHVGEPDTDPGDRPAVERLFRDHGHEIAQCRTGSALKAYKTDFPELNKFPPLKWFADQAPSSWPIEVPWPAIEVDNGVDRAKHSCT